MGFGSDDLEAPGAQQASGCLKDERIIVDHDNELAGAWRFHVTVRRFCKSMFYFALKIKQPEVAMGTYFRFRQECGS
jgi:hypothetical protein